MPWRRTGMRIVTSSSAAVGCTASVASRSALVAPSVSATPTSWINSAGLGADDVAAEHAAAGALHDQFHQRALLAAGKGRLHGRGRSRAVDVDVGVPRECLGLGQADRADLGRREHGRGHETVRTQVRQARASSPPNTRSA